MKIAICVLTIIILVLYRKICRLQNKLQSQMKNYQKIIDEQNKRIQAEVHEKERMHAQVVSFTQEIQELKSAFENAKRELEFYKNIETDSGNLNSSDDNKQRDHLLEQVAEQIKTARTWQAQADSLDNIGLDGARLLLDPEQTFALSEMEHSCRNYFITGKAGTGKSFLLDAFRKTTEKSHVILAPTGIAALNVSGATLHSTFGYDNLVKLDVDNISEESIRLKSEKRQILQRVSTIIIDEISMVRADTFDKIDRILKVLNQSSKISCGRYHTALLAQDGTVTVRGRLEHVIEDKFLERSTTTAAIKYPVICTVEGPSSKKRNRRIENTNVGDLLELRIDEDNPSYGELEVPDTEWHML